MSYPFTSWLALPFGRLELPGWGKVFTALGVYDDPRWNGAPQRTIRGKLHGYLMRLSLDNWSERQTYFLGRYVDLRTQLVVKYALRHGDTFVDVGGNIGMITLLGSRCVGPTGRVITFEPNPEPASRIRQALQDNHIANVTLHNVGLSDAPATLTLTMITEHSGMGTLAPVDGEESKHITAQVDVQVVLGDTLIPENLPGAMAIKVDIEGFETRALRGLVQTMRHYQPVIITEVVAHHLHRAGSSVAELFDLMRAQGYQPYAMDLHRRKLRHDLSLRLIQQADESMDTDVAWVIPGSAQHERLGSWICA